MDALPEGLHALVRCAATHADDDRAGQDPVRQRAESGDRDPAERRELLHLLVGAVAHATPHDARAAVARTEETAELFVLSGLGPENC